MTVRKLLIVGAGGKQQQIGTDNVGGFTFNKLKVTGVPAAPDDAVSKSYADAVAGGFDPKDAVKVATNGNLAVTAAGSGVGKTLTATSNGAISALGSNYASLVVNDRILVKDQSTASHNGVYKVTTAGNGGAPFVLTRADDFNGDPSGEVSQGAYMLVIDGDHAGQNWYLTTPDPITVDTTSLTFGQASVAAVVPDATEGSGGGTKGKITVDTDTPGSGLLITSGKISVKLDGTSIGKSTSGLKISDLGVTESMLEANLQSFRVKTNNSIASITSGHIVYVLADGTVEKAVANDAAKAEATLGIATQLIGSGGGSGNVALVPGTRIAGTWTAGATYYLPVAGGLPSATAPSGSGEYIVVIGRAISSTELLFNPEPAIEIL